LGSRSRNAVVFRPPDATILPGVGLSAAFASTAIAVARRVDCVAMARDPPPVGSRPLDSPCIWRAVADATSASAPPILTTTARNPTGEGCPVAVLDATERRDGTLATRVRPGTGKLGTWTQADDLTHSAWLDLDSAG